MNAKERYNQRQDELADAQMTGHLPVDGIVYSLETDEGWQAYYAECDAALAEYWRNLAQEGRKPTP